MSKKQATTKSARKARKAARKSATKAAAPKTLRVPATASIIVSPAPADRIKVLVDANPKRPGTVAHKLFAAYEKAATVADYTAAVGKLRGVEPHLARVGLRWDQRHGYVQIVSAPAKVPAAQ
jgi:hypothetical protein